MSEHLIEKLCSVKGVSMLRVNQPVVSTPDAWQFARQLMVDESYVPTDVSELELDCHFAIDYWARESHDRVVIHLIPEEGRIRFAPYVQSGEHWTLWAQSHDSDLVDSTNSGEAAQIELRIMTTSKKALAMEWIPGIY